MYFVLTMHLHAEHLRTLPTLCREKKPLLQMVLLSALNGGFLSSLVVMMAPTFTLFSLSYSLFLSRFFSSNRP